MPIAWPARLRGRLTLALAASLVLHGVAALGLYLVGRPVTIVAVKRGEPLFVELPETPDRAPAGNPAERRPGPRALETRRAPAPPAVRPVPLPVPVPPPPEPERAAPPPPAAPVVASRPAEPPATRPAPTPEPPVPPSPPPAASRPEPAPAPAPATVPSTPEPASPSPAPSVAAVPARPSVPSGGVAAPPPAAPAAGSPASTGSSSLVAAAPSGPPAPPPPPPPVDIRSALRGGAGGRGDGRGGIEGEPVPLDTPDARYSEYFDRVRRMIKERWGYPCVKNAVTRECEYKTASLIVEFGIAKDGRVPFVTVRQSSGWPIYDDYAVNAIKLAAPFPPIPDAVSRTGLPVLARFNYIVDTSLTNLLR